MKGKRYTETFEIDAVKQLADMNCLASEISEQQGVAANCLYNSIKSYKKLPPRYINATSTAAQITVSRSELRNLVEERNILKAGHHVLNQEPRIKYAFIRDNRSKFSVRSMCRVFEVHFSGYYSWLKTPRSARALEDQRLFKLINESYSSSGGTYGSPRVHKRLRELGEKCSVHRVARIMREGKLRAKLLFLGFASFMENIVIVLMEAITAPLIETGTTVFMETSPLLLMIA